MYSMIDVSRFKILGMQSSMDFTKAVSNYDFNHETVSIYGFLSRLFVEKIELNNSEICRKNLPV